MRGDFPSPGRLSLDCQHLSTSYCFDCLRGNAAFSQKKCPTCSKPIDPEVYRTISAELIAYCRFPGHLVPPAASSSCSASSTPPPVVAAAAGTPAVTVSPPVDEWGPPEGPATGADGGQLMFTLLAGETLSIPFVRATTIENVRKAIEKAKGIAVDRQRFVWHGKEVRTAAPDGKMLTLGDHWTVVPQDSVQLMIVLLHTGQSNGPQIRNVVFRLEWNSRDTLDACCLLFRDDPAQRVRHIDYRTRKCHGVIHSGDPKEDAEVKVHEIRVDLLEISHKVTRLFFVLSRFKGNQLDTPVTIRLFDERAPTVQLSDFNCRVVDNPPSVVMTQLYRTKAREWEVQAIGKTCEGTTWNYPPIEEACRQFIPTDTAKNT